MALVKSNATAKFDETVEIAVQLGVDPRHADQMVRGVVGLPNGTGKDVRVAVFARGPKAEEAQAEANDLYGFSRVVKDKLDHAGKCQLIEDMWVIALSDAEKAPYEEMIIRRLVGLIHLEDIDSAAARRRAEGRARGQ